MGLSKEKSKGFDRSVLPWQAMVLILILSGSFCLALDHSVVYPIGPATIPPSTYSNDLVPRSNPIDNSGNLVMTGNVAAGMQFRGRVPYGAATDLRTSLGSTYLDAFLRNSQGSLEAGSQFGDRIPFYSPTATVARMVPGSTDLFTPSTGWGWILPTGVPKGDSDDTSRSTWSIMDGTAEEAQQTIQRYSFQGLWTGLQTTQSQVTVQSATSQEGFVGMPALPEDRDTNEPLDRFRIGLDRGGMDRGLEGWDTEETPSDPCGPAVRFPVMGTSSPKRDKTIHPVGTLDGFWQTRYEQCMEMARTRLKEGHPQQAVDAYTLAILYKPADTLALAGKSHALFVCGEFVSSALFLERALEICPDYTSIPIDLAQWVGGVEVLRSRVEEASYYLRQNDSPELRLILAYAYYRMGDMRTAQETVEKATEGARPRPALQVLKQAVSDALRGETR
jgi:hypothetical protein